MPRYDPLRQRSLVYLLSVCLLAIGPIAAINPPARAQAQWPIERQTQEVVSRLIGIMDSSAQAMRNAAYRDVRLTICQVTVEDASASVHGSPVTFLYQEQALSQNLAQPYRQRFLRIAPSADRLRVESAVFEPAAPQTLIGFCTRPEATRLVSMSAIGQSNCSVLLRRAAENYVGSTPAAGCPNHFRDATRVTSEVVLSPTGLESWDRGFDATGQQVWGATAGPYQFRRIEPTPQAANAIPQTR